MLYGDSKKKKNRKIESKKIYIDEHVAYKLNNHCSIIFQYLKVNFLSLLREISF